MPCFTVAVLSSALLLAQKSPEQTGVPQNPSPMIEHTRSHPRLSMPNPPGRRETLSLGNLFIPAKLESKSQAPVLFFFHGKGLVAEIAGARNNMVVVSAVLGAGSRVYAKPFLDPSRFGKLLREAEARAGMKLRICLEIT